VARVLGGIKIVLDTRDFSLTPHLVMDGFWESWVTLWVQANINKDDHALNIGANCGYFTLLMAEAGASVVAVEPQPHFAAGIRLSAALNGCSDRVKVEECVAGCENQEVTFQLHEHLAGDAYVDRGGEERAGFSPTRAQERPAHELMPSATVAFIDAEGYEPYIWQGLAPLLEKRQLRWVALEWTPRKYSDPAAFLAELSQCGPLAIIRDDGHEQEASMEALLRVPDFHMLVIRPR
jgi:FkbM family methyltransferase